MQKTDPLSIDIKPSYDDIINNCTLGECEHTPSSHLSPGIVEDNECLIRAIFSPQHYDVATNSIHPNAFNDVFTIGLSVDRFIHTSPEKINDFAYAFLERKQQIDKENGVVKDRKFIGVIYSYVDEIRSFTENPVVILDTALENNISHSDICSCRRKASKTQKQAIRGLLTKKFTDNPTSPHEAFSLIKA